MTKDEARIVAAPVLKMTFMTGLQAIMILAKRTVHRVQIFAQHPMALVAVKARFRLDFQVYQMLQKSAEIDKLSLSRPTITVPPPGFRQRINSTPLSQSPPRMTNTSRGVRLSPTRAMNDNISRQIAMMSSTTPKASNLSNFRNGSNNGISLDTVKDTVTVKRKKASLPQQKPNATSGNWLTNRYIVNDYILLNELGKGSYAEVRLCKEKTSDRLFAIKIMSKQFLRKKNFMDDVKREVAIMKKLRHENVLRLYEVIDDLYLVLEYMKRGDLYSTNALGDNRIWSIARQILRGLSYLHRNSIVHGDIKPQNLLLGEDGRVKIADFGISKMLQGNEKQLETAGTPAFMSPELCAGSAYDGKLADVYAVGATLFCLRCGHPPFNVSQSMKSPAKQILSLYKQIQNDPIVFTVSVSSGLKLLVEGMMEKIPLKRMTLDAALRNKWLLSKPSPNESVQDNQKISILAEDFSIYPKIVVTNEDVFHSVREICVDLDEMTGQSRPTIKSGMKDKAGQQWKMKSLQRQASRKNHRFERDHHLSSSSCESDDSYDDSDSLICGIDQIMQTLDHQPKICSDMEEVPSSTDPISDTHSGGFFDKPNRLRVAIASEQGPRRTQEDSSTVKFGLCTKKGVATKTTESFFGVFDGHAGNQCSHELVNILPDAISRAVMSSAESADCDNFELCIKLACKEVDEKICTLLRRMCDKSGSTALFALIDSNRIVVSGVGDSCALLSRKGVSHQLSKVHRLSNEEEKQRVQAGGGIIRNERVNGVLAVTRSFGDIQHKIEAGPSVIDPIPDTYVCPITNDDDFLLLGTDGLFDVIQAQEAVNIVKRDLRETLNCEMAIQNLVRFALERGSCDNVTAILIMFNQQ
eukprot:CAMPEP_0116009484 /NCGR_PEP_ID=MMETSP0321-20121206/3459_1 /TAXON_ID=163516 /ORGANISM="Leptocylindrus danicus var. danicus, Strain B650" /LENGTH=865 /DNA_ID=CAMNT_0003478453 /DNA_START=29 /DNA_END=2627 /DNA_ORIENTATION=+